MKLDFKFISTAIMVPIIIGAITSYISFKMDKPKEYMIRESFDLDKLDVTEYFPLEVGNYWLYSRNMIFNDGNNDKKIKDELKVEVIKHYENGDSQLFVMKGDPLNESENAKDVTYGYLVISNKVVKVNSLKIDSIIEKFENKEGLYADDLDGLFIEYEFPLFDGQRYGELEHLFKPDAKSINYVTKLNPYKRMVEGNIMDIGVYTIDNLNNSGDERQVFVPYLGITEFSYEHRGTTDKYYIDLKEYKLNSD